MRAMRSSLASRLVESLTHKPQADVVTKTGHLADARLDLQLHSAGSRIRLSFGRPGKLGSTVPLRVSRSDLPADDAG